MDEKSKSSIDSHISAYLRRPIRTLKEAEQAKDVSDLSVDTGANNTDLPRDAVSRGSISRS